MSARPGLVPAAGAAWLALALFAACSGPTVFLRRAEPPPCWPPAPQPPRVQHLLAYGGTQDVERHPGWFASLLALFAGSDSAELMAPAGVALAADDVLWIADPGLGAVHRLSLQSGDHRICTGSDQEPLRTPVGIAIGKGGAVFVTDSTRARIVELRPDGSVAGAFGSAAELGRPTGIAWDAACERLLVVDTTGCRLLALSADGRERQRLGGRGDQPGQFNYPTNVAVAPDGRIVVVDSLNFRVQVLSRELQPLGSFGVVGRGPGCFCSPKGIAVDADGHAWVVDAMFENLQIFDLSGQLLLVVGSHGQQLGDYQLPSGICAGSGDRIVVADAGNARIQILHYLRSGT